MIAMIELLSISVDRPRFAAFPRPGKRCRADDARPSSRAFHPALIGIAPLAGQRPGELRRT